MAFEVEGRRAGSVEDFVKVRLGGLAAKGPF
jgi:hypothetical protein